MMQDFVPILVYMGIVAAATVALLVVSLLISKPYADPNAVKGSTYECGEVPVGAGRVQFLLQYYAYVIMFLIFDVLSMFLFTWSVSLFAVGVQGSLLVFLFLLLMVPALGLALYLSGRRELWRLR